MIFGLTRYSSSLWPDHPPPNCKWLCGYHCIWQAAPKRCFDCLSLIRVWPHRLHKDVHEHLNPFTKITSHFRGQNSLIVHVSRLVSVKFYIGYGTAGGTNLNPRDLNTLWKFNFAIHERAVRGFAIWMHLFVIAQLSHVTSASRLSRWNFANRWFFFIQLFFGTTHESITNVTDTNI